MYSFSEYLGNLDLMKNIDMKIYATEAVNENEEVKKDYLVKFKLPGEQEKREVTISASKKEEIPTLIKSYIANWYGGTPQSTANKVNNYLLPGEEGVDKTKKVRPTYFEPESIGNNTWKKNVRYTVKDKYDDLNVEISEKKPDRIDLLITKINNNEDIESPANKAYKLLSKLKDPSLNQYDQTYIFTAVKKLFKKYPKIKENKNLKYIANELTSSGILIKKQEPVKTYPHIKSYN